jgi:hypothetical protein
LSGVEGCDTIHDARWHLIGADAAIAAIQIRGWASSSLFFCFNRFNFRHVVHLLVDGPA